MRVIRLVTLVFILLPLVFLGVSLFAGPWPYPLLLPSEWSLRSLSFLWRSREGLIRALGSSLAYSFLSVIFATLLSWAPARYLARHSFRGKALVEGLLLAPAIIPSITFAAGLYRVVLFVGLSDTLVGVALSLSLTGYPYLLRSLKIGYLLYPMEYTNAAKNLGASRWQQWWEVEVPAMIPALASGVSLVFLTAFSEYFLVFLIGGGRVESFAGYLVPFIQASDRGMAAGLTLGFLVVPLGLFGLQELYLRRR
ncbi:MAG: ABC transporter permease subunit [Spirochaetales bacterium]|nr:ABC transporter permease subunit [Spirochaetales bacterium]